MISARLFVQVTRSAARGASRARLHPGPAYEKRRQRLPGEPLATLATLAPATASTAPSWRMVSLSAEGCALARLLESECPA